MNYQKTQNLIEWFNIIFRERICSDINVIYIESLKPQWQILFPNNSLKISCDLILDLYELGEKKELGCSRKDFSEFDNLYFKDLILPGLINPPKYLFSRNENHLHFEYDFLGLIYMCLSRLEEYNLNSDLKDKHNRFLAKHSHAFINNYLDRPLIDEWIYYLKFLVKKFCPRIDLISSKFKIYLSHDVDLPSKYHFLKKREIFYNLTSQLIKYRRFQEVKNILRIYSSREKLLTVDPYNKFDWIMDISEKNNIKSTFNFMTGISTRGYDSEYKIDNLLIENLIKNINSRGHYIGLHPSYYSYKKPYMIKKEAMILKSTCNKLKINQPRWGGRMHYLRWHFPLTARGWELSGLDYDSTLSFAEMPGFRSGNCFEYQMYDPIEGRVLKIRQKPLIIMEVSIFNKKYLDLDCEESIIKFITPLKDRVKALDGEFTILWHNSNFLTKKMQRIYELLIS